MKKLSKKQKQIIELTVLLVMVIVSIIIWDSIIIYPIKLMTVLLHEISHGLAAVVSGGSIISLDINTELSGSCIVEGGNSIIIASSGYLGSLMFGLLFIYSSYNNKSSKWILISISIIIILFSINTSNNFSLQIFSLLLVITLLIIYFFAPSIISKYLIIFIGIVSCLYVVVDIKNDLIDSSNVSSDALVIANLTGINELVWGLLWFTISIIGLVLVIRYGYKKGIN